MVLSLWTKVDVVHLRLSLHVHSESRVGAFGLGTLWYPEALPGPRLTPISASSPKPELTLIATRLTHKRVNTSLTRARGGT